MQIVKLGLSHPDFFCPATGEQIMGGEMSLNEEARSLQAYWVSEGFDDPFLNNKALGAAWNAWSMEYKKKNYENPFDEQLLLFLQGYNEAEWVVFQLTSYGSAFPITCWLVLDLDTYLEEK